MSPHARIDPVSQFARAPAPRAAFHREGDGQKLTLSQSAERKAANESAFRNLNESIEETREDLSLTEGRTPYLCECDDPRCTQTIRLAMAEYESVRANPRQFVVAPDHDPTAAVVLKEEGFTIVEKTGEEGRLVEQQDPRTS